MKETLYFEFKSELKNKEVHETLMRSGSLIDVELTVLTDERRERWMKQVMAFAYKSLQENQQ